MKISELKNSRFLAKDHVDPPKRATISHVAMQNVAPPDQQPEQKGVLHFKESEIKPLVLNIINMDAIAEIARSNETDDWGGTEIVLYHDPNVIFGGRRVGGVRIRAVPQTRSAVADQDIPF